MPDIQEENQVSRRSRRNHGNVGSPANKFSPKIGERKGKKTESSTKTPKSIRNVSKDVLTPSSTSGIHEDQLLPAAGQHSPTGENMLSSATPESKHKDMDDNTPSAMLHPTEQPTPFNEPVTDTIAAEVRSFFNSAKFADLLKSTITDAISKELYDLRVQLETAEGQILQLENDLKAKEKVITSLNEQQRTDHSAIVNLQEKANDAEQYQRRNCLRFFGIQESEGEVTNQKIRDVAQSKLGINLGPTAIDRSHRVGPPSRGRQVGPRAIIVKFTQYDVRQDVIKSRRKLKGSRMGIDEDLTSQNRALLDHAKKAVEATQHLEAAWSIDGRVIVLVKKPGGRTEKKRIRSESDLTKL